MAATIRRLGSNLAIVDDGRHGEPCLAYRDVKNASSPSTPDDTWNVVGPEKVVWTLAFHPGLSWTAYSGVDGIGIGIADRAYKIVSISGRHAEGDTGCSWTVEKIATASAMGGGTLVHSGTHVGTAANDDDLQALTILTTAAGKLAIGDLLYLDVVGTSAVIPSACVTVVLVPDIPEIISTS